jgi:hypothetical protein
MTMVHQEGKFVKEITGLVCICLFIIYLFKWYGSSDLAKRYIGAIPRLTSRTQTFGTFFKRACYD